MTYPQCALYFAAYELGVYIKANAFSFPLPVDSPYRLTPESSVENEDVTSMLNLVDCSTFCI